MLIEIDCFFYSVLPDEIYILYRNSVNGIGKVEVAALKERLAGIVNKYVDFPFVSEETEQSFFELIINLLCDAIQKGASLLKVVNAGRK